MFLCYRATTTMSMADFPCQIRNRFGLKCQIEIRHILGNFGVEKVRIPMSTFALIFAVVVSESPSINPACKCRTFSPVCSQI